MFSRGNQPERFRPLDQAKVKPPFYPIVKDPELLSFCTRKRVYLHKYGLEVMSRIYRSAEYIITYNGVQYKTDLVVGMLRFFEPILYVDFVDFNLTIDLSYDETVGYTIIVWTGKMKEKAAFPNLSILPSIGMSQTNEKGDIAYVSKVINDHQQAHDELERIVNSLRSSHIRGEQ